MMVIGFLEMSQDTDDEGKLVSMILEANKYVRYACICDSEGKMLWNCRRKDIESMITLEDTKKSLKMAIENWKKRDEITKKIGRGKYSIVGYEKLTRVTIPLRNNHLLYIHVEGSKPEYIGDMMKIVDYVAEHPS